MKIMGSPVTVTTVYAACLAIHLVVASKVEYIRGGPTESDMAVLMHIVTVAFWLPAFALFFIPFAPFIVWPFAAYAGLKACTTGGKWHIIACCFMIVVTVLSLLGTGMLTHCIQGL